jgi:hypothetical protein
LTAIGSAIEEFLMPCFRILVLFVIVLGGCGYSPPDYAGVMKNLSSTDAELRATAANRLGRYYHQGCSREGMPPVKEVVNLLTQNLQDEDEFASGEAALALGNIGPEAKMALPNLIEMIKKKDARREAAILALGGIGVEAKGAIPILEECAKDREQRIREFALQALVQISADQLKTK